MCCQCPCVVSRMCLSGRLDCTEVPMYGAYVLATTASCSYTCSKCYLLCIGSTNHCINKHACASILTGACGTLAASPGVIGVRSQSMLQTNLHPSPIHTAQVAALPMLHTTMMPMRTNQQQVKGKIVSKCRCAAPVTTTTLFGIGNEGQEGKIYHQ